MNKIGMGAPNGFSDLTDFLGINFGSVLVIHGDHSLEQVRLIKERNPDTRIIMRRYGGVGGSPTRLAREIVDLYGMYSRFGVVDWIAWNEPDRVEEGGFSTEYVAMYADVFEKEIRRLSQQILIHWPAWAHEPRYQGAQVQIWKPVAERFDAIDFHAYGSVGYVKAYLRWHASHFPEHEWFCTEFNYGLGNARPANYGQMLFDAYEECYRWTGCNSLHPFIWEWINPEPGGDSLSIRRDVDAVLGVQQAVRVLPTRYGPVPPPPAPDPEPPKPEPEVPTMQPIRKSMMLWQHNNCRERSVAEWVETLRIGDIDTLRVKSHQHLNFMGNVYNHPLAPRSIDVIKRFYDEFGQQGINYIPWCVPMGLNVRQEAELAVQVARACGNHIDIDLEPYPEFWNVNLVGNGGIPEYFDIIKQSGVSVVCDFDARSNLADPLGLSRIAHLVDRFLTQSYWVGFGQPYHSVIKHAVNYMRGFGARQMGIVLDARGGRDITRAAAFAQEMGCVEVSCWAADMASLLTYEAFGDIPTEPMFNPDPVPPSEAEQLLVAIGEQYRIVHQILHPMVRIDARVDADAAVRTYDEQLNVIKRILSL